MIASHAGKIQPLITYNTIADNESDGIAASSYNGNTNPVITGNLLANNRGYGYHESTPFANVQSRHNNLFYANDAGHYFDFDDDVAINSEAGLNTSIDGGLGTASGNLVADPLFITGKFYWKGEAFEHEPARYFLSQNGSTSPAVDAGDSEARNRGENGRGTALSARTTCTHGIVDESSIRRDTGLADIGFHYSVLH